jgi:DNA-binding MarR family transcriptional regulator
LIKEAVLKALERQKMLTLAMQRQIKQREVAHEIHLSPSHTKKLIKRLRELEEAMSLCSTGALTPP